MEMEGLENNNNIAKGKRTKRLRLCGVSGAVTMTSSCSSANSGGASFSSITTSTDQEEEDMANCLILLAQGGRKSHPYNHPHHHDDDEEEDDHVDDGNNKAVKGNRRFPEVIGTATNTNTNTNSNTNSNTKVEFYIYECKTCNRTFPSFQALGGHRASHKRPKLTLEEKKPPQAPSPSPQAPSPSPQLFGVNYDKLEEAEGIKSVPPISIQLGHKAFFNNNNNNHHNKGTKIHECSICGSEFTSGQALGGHMRRHRTSSNSSCNPIKTAGNTNAESVPARNILQLDLNLPAPEDDMRVQFSASQKSMVLAGAPALVDCHY